VTVARVRPDVRTVCLSDSQNRRLPRSKVASRLVRAAFVLGVVSALAFGGRAALAGTSVSQCLCDPDDPDPDLTCVQCCMADDSVCPVGGGSEPRECICA
jgi:hypothetical protein